MRKGQESVSAPPCLVTTARSRLAAPATCRTSLTMKVLYGLLLHLALPWVWARLYWKARLAPDYAKRIGRTIRYRRPDAGWRGVVPHRICGRNERGRIHHTGRKGALAQQDLPRYHHDAYRQRPRSSLVGRHRGTLLCALRLSVGGGSIPAPRATRSAHSHGNRALAQSDRTHCGVRRCVPSQCAPIRAPPFTVIGEYARSPGRCSST